MRLATTGFGAETEQIQPFYFRHQSQEFGRQTDREFNCDPFRGPAGQSPWLQPGRRPRIAPQGLRVFGPGAQGTDPPFGRALPRPPDGSGRHPRGHEARRGLHCRRPAARRGRGHAHDAGQDP